MKNAIIYEYKKALVTLDPSVVPSDMTEALLASRDNPSGLKEYLRGLEYTDVWNCYRGHIIPMLNNSVARIYRALELRKESAYMDSHNLERVYADETALRDKFAEALNTLLDFYGLKILPEYFRAETFFPKAGDFRKNRETAEYMFNGASDEAFRKFTERLMAELIEARVALTPEQYKEAKKAAKKAKKEAEKAAQSK